MELRDYQRRSIASVFAALTTKQSVILQNPTGSGKTVIAEHIIRRGIEKGRRVTFIADRLTLIDQVVDRFLERGFDFGVIQSNHPMHRPHAPVQIASVQTLNNRPHEFWPRSSLYIVDECQDQHQSVYEHMDYMGNEAKFLGLSATPFSPGLGAHWEGLVVGATTGELIREGWLSPYIAYGPDDPDMRGVRVRAGDYAVDALDDLMTPLTGSVVGHYLRMSRGQKALLFAPSVDSAKAFAEEFRQNGVVAEYVSGHDSDERRREMVKRYRDGDIEVICNCEVMIKGLDEPDIQTIILARPTKSLSYHIQMVGRGLRPAPGKNRLLILDHAGNIRRMGFPDDPLPQELDDGVKSPAKKKLDAPTKEPKPWRCPECTHMCEPRSRTCSVCGYIIRAMVPKQTRGKLVELVQDTLTPGDNQRVYAMLLGYAQEKGFKRGWASHKYNALFGEFPDGMFGVEPIEPSPEIKRWVAGQNYAARKRAGL